ncbi:MAG: hypothetical protein Q8T04_05015 [Bacteroidota bacterium]|nr:hypothetical protein [Bacteroidota bacterium]
MNSASSFKEFYESSFLKGENPKLAKKLSEEFLADFIHYTPLKLELLESYLSGGQIEQFYMLLPDLKYLIEFSDDLNRYWHLLRAYSGALSKLKNDLSVKGAKNLYAYYFSKYGDRRFLRNEHWFEKKRWEFLDEIQNIYSEDQLRQFVIHYKRITMENMTIYTSFLMLFIKDLENLNMPQNTIPSKDKVK